MDLLVENLGKSTGLFFLENTSWEKEPIMRSVLLIVHFILKGAPYTPYNAQLF